MAARRNIVTRTYVFNETREDAADRISSAKRDWLTGATEVYLVFLRSRLAAWVEEIDEILKNRK